jgi:hypothetical protein
MNFNAESIPAASAVAPAILQGELFELADVEGYGVLTRRERIFAQAIFDGCTQREAARRAGVTGSDESADVAASRLIRSPQVRRLLDQAWTRAGADISQTLREAEEVRRRAYRELIDAPNSKRGKDALDQWKVAATLIATIHGRLSLRVEGQINHTHGGVIATVVVPAEALPAMAALRREIMRERLGPSDKAS